MEILKTERLSLRWLRPTPADSDFVLALLNDPDWLRHIGPRGVHTAADAAAFIRDRLMPAYGDTGHGFWALCRTGETRPVGLCGLVRRPGQPHPDIGYALLPAGRGQGLAREGAAATLRYAREVLGLREVWGLTALNNAVSGRVLTDIGLQDAGRWRSASLGTSRLYRWRAEGPVPAPAAAVRAVVERFIHAADQVGDTPPAWPSLPQLCLPTAVFHDLPAWAPPPQLRRQAGVAPPPPVIDLATGLPQGFAPPQPARASDLHGYIAPQAQALWDGRLTRCRTQVKALQIDVRDRVASAWLRSERTGWLDGQAFRHGGTRLLQLLQTDAGWKIAAVTRLEDAPARPRPRA